MTLMRLKTFTTVGHQQGHGASGQISFTTGESKEKEGGGRHAPALGPISFICLQVLATIVPNGFMVPQLWDCSPLSGKAWIDNFFPLYQVLK